MIIEDKSDSKNFLKVLSMKVIAPYNTKNKLLQADSVTLPLQMIAVHDKET